ncbi:hypothetical protein BT69DRAFT_1357604 [Atractiella rhizophila]|nr:hypothetical protein BT69DRAFT_1357604 [Atractiella rhizophila]
MTKFGPPLRRSDFKPRIVPPHMKTCPIHDLPLEIMVHILVLASIDMRRSKRHGSLNSVTWISSLSILSPLFASACQSLIFKKPFIQSTFQLSTLHATLLAKPSLAHYVREILFVPRASDFDERFIQESRYERQRVDCELKAKNLNSAQLDNRSKCRKQIENWRKGITDIIQLCSDSLRGIRMVSMPPAVYLDPSICDLFCPSKTPKLELLEFGTVSVRDALIINSVFGMLDHSHCPTIVFRQVSSISTPGSFRSPQIVSRLNTANNRFLTETLTCLKLYQSRIAPTDLQDILSLSPFLSRLHFLDTRIIGETARDTNDEKIWSAPFLKFGEQLKELSFKWAEYDGFGNFFWIYDEGDEDWLWNQELLCRILQDIIQSCRSLLSLEINTMWTDTPGPVFFFKLLAPSLKYFHLTLHYCTWDDHRVQPELDLLTSEKTAPKFACGLEKLVLGLVSVDGYGSRGPGPFMESIREIFYARGQTVDLWFERGEGTKDRMLVPYQDWLKKGGARRS